MAELDSNIEISVKDIPEVKEMLENMKCCGNCINMTIYGGVPICKKNDHIICHNPRQSCNHWGFDNITNKDRQSD